MEYRILGSIEVLDPSGRKLPLGGAMQQSVLASLLLRAGQTVVLDRLVEELWDDPPATAARTVQAYVSRLRHELPKRAIESRPGGYVLRLDGDELDLDTFARGAEEGHAALAAGDHEQAARLLREALALWRGPALAGLASEALRRHAEQLEEQRLSALEDRLEADLESARHSEIVPELTALVAEHPFRERLRAQLMRAFYRSGRPGEALALYRETRRLLVQDLGMEPGQELRELEQAILRQDPALAEAPSPEPRTAATEIVPVPLLEREPLGSQGPTPAAASRYPRRRTIAYGALAGVIAAAVAIPLFALGGGGVDQSDLGEASGNSVAVLDAGSGDVRDAVELKAPPTALGRGFDLVWAASADSNVVFAIDPKTNTKLQTIPVGNAPGGVAVGADYVWVTNSLDGTVSQIDPHAQIELQQIRVGNGPTGVAVDETGGHVWVANTSDHTLSKIRASNGVLLKNYSTVTDPGAVAFGDGAVWVASKSNDTVVKLNARDGQPLSTIGVGHSPAAIAVGLGSVWVANSVDGTVTQIDSASDRVVDTYKVGANPGGIGIVGREVWTTNELDGTVSRINPAERLPTTVPVRGRPSALAAGGGTVYVATRPTGNLHRGGTLRVVLASFDPLRSVDLAVGSTSSLTRFAALTNDGLLAYRHVGGQAGYQLVPDLARSMPEISDDRKTYLFQLRRNIRYSNGRLVRARDFRYAIERVFKLRPRPDAWGVDTFRGIRGADRCNRGHCNLAAGIVADDRARTITFHLSAPDPDFRYKLAFPLAVPAGTPLQEAKRQPLPATGPYRIASFTRHSVRLVRNKYFRPWLQAAQPQGFPDEIGLKAVPTPGRGIALVENDEADLTSSQTLTPFAVAPRFRPWMHEHPLAGMPYLVLDPRRPPFDDPRVRRALNYAIDRKKVAFVTAKVGPRARPTCQVLPPNFPAYRRYCPYTLKRRAGGAWTAPDPAEAARLLAASRRAGTPVTLWVDRNFGGIRVARYLKRLLQDLGYRPQLRQSFGSTPKSYFKRLEGGAMSRRGGPQIAYVGWESDYPAASGFIQPLFSCRSKYNYSRYCDPALERRIRQAVDLEQTDRAGANRLWAKLDREVTDRALLVPLYNGTGADLVSKRVGNYQYNPQYGPLLSQLWVR